MIIMYSESQLEFHYNILFKEKNAKNIKKFMPLLWSYHLSDIYISSRI